MKIKENKRGTNRAQKQAMVHFSKKRETQEAIKEIVLEGRNAEVYIEIIIIKTAM